METLLAEASFNLSCSKIMEKKLTSYGAISINDYPNKFPYSMGYHYYS